MKLRSVELHRVGKYQGQQIGEFQNGLTLLYGPNEAGKSTLLAGLRGLLFGRVMLAEADISAPAGAFGRARLETEKGQEVLLERTLSRKNPPKLFFHDGTVRSGQQVLQETFKELAEIEEILYRSVFTFQLSDLRDIREKGDALNGRIYSVSMIGGRNPAEIESELEAAAKGIFNPHRAARNAELNQCFSELEEVSRLLFSTEDRPEFYQKLQERLNQLDCSAAELDGRIQAAQKELSEARVRLAALPSVQRWLSLQSRLQALRSIPHHYIEQAPEVGLWRQKIKELRTKHVEVEQQMNGVREELGSIHADETLLLVLPDLRSTLEELSGYTQQERQRIQLADELRELEQNQMVICERLSPVWSEEILTSADLSVARVTEIKELLARLEQAEEALRRAGEEKRDRQLDVEAAIRPLRETSVDVNDPVRAVECRRSEIDKRKEQVRYEEDLVESWIHTLQNVQTLEGNIANRLAINQTELYRAASPHVEQGRLTMVGWAAVVGLLAVSAWQFMKGSIGPAVFSLCFVLMMVLLLVRLSLSSKTTRSNQSSQKAENQSKKPDELEQQYGLALRQLERLEAEMTFIRVADRSIDTAVELRRQIRAKHLAYEHDERQLSLLEQALVTWQTASLQRQRAEDRVRVAEEQVSRIHEMWEHLRCNIFGFNAPITLSACVEELQLVSEWRTLERQRRQKQEEQHLLYKNIFLFCSNVTEWLDIHFPVPQVSHKSEPAAAGEAGAMKFSLSDVQSRLKQAVQDAEAAEQAEKFRQERIMVLKHLQQREMEIREEIQSLESSVAAVFTGLGVDDWPSYDAILEEAYIREQVTRECTDIFHQLIGLFGGSEQRTKTAIDTLSGMTTADIEDVVSEAEQKLSALQEEQKKVIEERGGVLSRIQEFEKNEISSFDLAWRDAALRTKRDRLIQEWAELTLAKVIVNQARRAWEEKHQPKALIAAGKILREISGGRYVNMKSRLDTAGEAVLYALDAEGRAFDLPILSRGTKEQIYLSLRLALIQMYREHGIILPVVLDDPMVNFDKFRTEQYFRILAAQAKGHQYIYLTCHEHMVDLARQHEGVQIIILNE